MTDLTRLSVSLTKHGAHKVRSLLEKFPVDDVLKNTWDKHSGIRIDRAQARKILSAFAGDKLPGIWAEAKRRGSDTLRHLVFLGIAFSHHTLIDALVNGGTADGKGTILRAALGGGKAFTNFKNDLEELGLATAAQVNSVAYDLRGLLANPQLGDLAAQLFSIKLSEAGWNGSPSLIDECVRFNFHKVLSCSEADFRRWLTISGKVVPQDDELPDTKDANEEAISPFRFHAGHTDRKTGTIARRSTRAASARLLHNEIQSVLYAVLVAAHGKANVGTELSTGSSTTIDLVVKVGVTYEFYEIKTSPSIKKCLRQALSQLIEYTYWPSAARATKMVVASEASITRDGELYLKHLRSIGIPVYYRQVDRSKKTVSKEY
ncbi:hypothetical protein [Mesorhizobium sp. 131-2-1]|uniref:hypothetical protein n=1 Tax=Mesorhizobium sp. 131-2-1 TaxID=2744518 RepID=UPI001925400A|nr:hypothetical protein [Mesorhizobium sp. 131-2-1]BCG92585.1 hypothetical protein MesoLj131a_14490 [Mesorhizobium sp. 131-2-1]